MINKPKITNIEIIEYTCLNKNNYNIFLAIFLPSKRIQDLTNQPIFSTSFLDRIAETI